MAARSTLLFAVFVVGAAAESLLDGLEKTDVREIRTRLEEEKAKRLLLQNDLEVLMLKFEQLERTCKGQTTVSALTETKQIQERISFSARLLAKTTLDKNHVITFDEVLQNHGSSYSPNTGIFKAPVAGTYVFSLSLLSGGKGLNVHGQIMKNGTEIGRLFTGSNVASWADQGSVTVVTSLVQNDEVYVREFAPSGTLHGDLYCTFTGFQIQ